MVESSRLTVKVPEASEGALDGVPVNDALVARTRPVRGW